MRYLAKQGRQEAARSTSARRSGVFCPASQILLPAKPSAYKLRLGLLLAKQKCGEWGGLDDIIYKYGRQVAELPPKLKHK